MSISIDHDKATKILLEEAALAHCESSAGVASEWLDRVTRLGELCPHGRSATVIAALGTALLAKATDDRVDVYSLLDRGEADNSYSARSLADNVWARNRACLNVDLGANGVNPLNNTPFIGKTHIREITGVRNREGWQYFCECMQALEALPSAADARQALRGFIVARSRSLISPLPVNVKAGDNLTTNELIAAIDEYVSDDSEGGRRAQACAAALLDTVFGEESVCVGVINDPDRVAPLDVSIRDQDGHFKLAFEVKDKPIEGHHVRSSVEKTVASHGLKNLGFIAVSKHQHQTDFGDEGRWAARHGVKITVFLDWGKVVLACKCFSPASGEVFEGKVYRRILCRAGELAVAPDGLRQLRRIAE